MTGQLFFKALKQNLRVKTFVGTSASEDPDLDGADRDIAADLKLRARWGWSLSNLSLCCGSSTANCSPGWKLHPPPGTTAGNYY